MLLSARDFCHKFFIVVKTNCYAQNGMSVTISRKSKQTGANPSFFENEGVLKSGREIGQGFKILKQNTGLRKDRIVKAFERTFTQNIIILISYELLKSISRTNQDSRPFGLTTHQRCFRSSTPYKIENCFSLISDQNPTFLHFFSQSMHR